MGVGTWQTDVVFELDINTHVIERVRLYAEGQATVNVEGSGRLSGSFTDSGSKSLGAYHVPYSPKFVVLGIPFIAPVAAAAHIFYKVVWTLTVSHMKSPSPNPHRTLTKLSPYPKLTLTLPSASGCDTNGFLV